MDIQLRPYQQECIDIIDTISPGAYLIVLFTGAGKTVIFSHIKREGRVLILSHREELVNQPRKYYDCSFGVERAEETSNGEEVVSASVQSLVRRLHKFRPDDFDIIITDEAHHAVAPSYQKIYKYFKPRLHLGFTATPNRADSIKLGKVYSRVIFERDIKWGIKNGYLSNIRCVQVDIGYDLKGARTRMGDFNQEDIEGALDIEKCNEAIADIYKNYAIGPTLIFAASVKHAQNLAALIPGTEVVTADTPNRAEILQQFAEFKIPAKANCMVLTEGTDLPMIKTILMCRPTRNASLYSQMVGRGTRLFPGKSELLLIDCVGDSKLSLCTAPILFGLDPEEAKKAKCQKSLITEMENKIECYKEKEMLTSPNAWKINMQLISLFEEKGGYDTHNINYTVCANKDMVCSIGHGVILRVLAEDATGNSGLWVHEGEEIVHRKDGIPMQVALDEAYETLKLSYSSARSLWDIEAAKKWGEGSASRAQKSFIRSLYEGSGEQINLKNVSKYQASCIINRKLDEEKKKRAEGKNKGNFQKRKNRSKPERRDTYVK